MSKVTDFLIDNSDKMDKKVQVAQRVLTEELIPNFDFSSTFGMRTFKSVCGSAIIIKQLDLKEKNDKATFLEKSEKMPMASGGSPLAEALSESMVELNNREEDTKKIILITAGEDTDGGIPEYEVENKAKKIQINVVGIGMSDTCQAKAEKIAQTTGGVCCNIPSADFNNNQAIHSIVAPVVEAMNNEKSVVATPQPQQPAKPEPKVVEVKKEEENVQSKPQPVQEKSRAFVAPPKMPEVSNIQISTVAKATTEEFDAASEMRQTAESAQDQISDIIATIGEKLNELSNNIPGLMQKDMQIVQKLLKNNEATAQENKALRTAEEQNIKSIEELKKINADAAGTISQLMQVIEDQRQIEEENKKMADQILSDREKAAQTIKQLEQTIAQKDAEIKALEENKVSMQAAIDELIGKLSSLRQ